MHNLRYSGIIKVCGVLYYLLRGIILLITAIAFILIIGVLVVVHEYGHFLAARIFKIDVKEFSVGFGPKLFTYLRKKGTDFNFRIFPLGGFVQMAGENIEDMEQENGFQSRNAATRAAVIFAGPLFSFLFAVFIFMIIGHILGFPSGNNNTVQMTMPKTEASRMDLKAGDKILSINGVKLTYAGEAVDIIHDSTADTITLEVERKGQIIEKVGSPSLNISYFLGANWQEDFEKKRSVFISAINDDCSLARQGAQKNDVLKSINGMTIDTIKDLDVFLKNNSDSDSYKLEFLRDKSKVSYTVKAEIFYAKFCGYDLFFPKAVILDNDSKSDGLLKTGDRIVAINGQKITDAQSISKAIGTKGTIKNVKIIPADKQSQERIIENWSMGNKYIPYVYKSVRIFGFIPGNVLKKENLLDSMKIGLRYVGLMLSETAKIFTSKDVKDNIGGPIAIVSMTNSAVNNGMFTIVIFVAGLSLSLAIFNVLPIPPLDGGHLAVIFIETVIRRRFTKEQLLYIQGVGFFIMMIIFVLVFTMDISKWITGALPK